MSTSPVIRRSRGVLCIVIVCAACMVYYHLALFVPRAKEVRAAQGFGNGYSFGADFYPIWFTAREGLAYHRDPYSPEMTRQIQIGLFGRPLDASNPAAPLNYRAFAYPAFADILFWPFALLPFSVVRIVLALILPVVTALSILLWLRILRLRAGPAILTALILLTLSSYAVLEGLFAEQMGLLAGFLLAASLAALVRERLFLSGSLLALTLIKSQMILLITAYLLFWSLARWRARWRFVAGFLFVSGLLLASSLLVWPRWIPEWLGVMFGYRQYSTPPLVWYLLGNQAGSRLGPILIATLLASALALAWRMRHASATSAEFVLTLSLLLAITAITLHSQPTARHHCHHSTAGTRGIRPCRAFARSDLDRLILARLRSKPTLSRHSGRNCIGRVLAMDKRSGCNRNQADAFAGFIYFDYAHAPHPSRRFNSFRSGCASQSDDVARIA